MFEKVSIELGKNVIKIAKGKYNKKIMLDSYFEININDYADSNDENLTWKTLGDLLDKAFTKNRLGKRNVNIILSCMPNLLLREMVIPYAKESESYNIIKFEAKDYFPVDLDRYIIDYKILEIFKEETVKKQRVLAVVAPVDLVERIENLSKSININFKCIDIEANVLSKFINSYRSYKGISVNDTVMVVNIQKDYITAAIVKNGLLSMSKTFTEDLSNITEDEEEELDFNKQLMVNDIAENIIKIGNFYSSREKVNIDKIYATGEISYMSRIANLLGEKTNIEIEIISGSQFIQRKGRNPKNKICAYTVAAGGII